MMCRFNGYHHEVCMEPRKIQPSLCHLHSQSIQKDCFILAKGYVIMEIMFMSSHLNRDRDATLCASLPVTWLLQNVGTCVHTYVGTTVHPGMYANIVRR